MKPQIQSHGQWIETLPNKLTMARIAAIPVLLIVFPLQFHASNIFCAVLFSIAAITDFLDGFIARRYNIVITLGSLLDPSQ